MRKITSQLIPLLSIFLFFSCNGGKNTATDSSSNNADFQQEKINIENQVKNAKTVDEAEKAIDGTTWHCTENLSSSEMCCWIKVDFKEGQYTSYYALPSDGKWTKDVSGTYEVKELLSPSGEYVMRVFWDGNIINPRSGETMPCLMGIGTDNLVLGVALLDDGGGSRKKRIMTGRMEYGDYSWD